MSLLHLLALQLQLLVSWLGKSPVTNLLGELLTVKLDVQTAQQAPQPWPAAEWSEFLTHLDDDLYNNAFSTCMYMLTLIM